WATEARDARVARQRARGGRAPGGHRRGPVRAVAPGRRRGARGMGALRPGGARRDHRRSDESAGRRQAGERRVRILPRRDRGGGSRPAQAGGREPPRQRHQVHPARRTHRAERQARGRLCGARRHRQRHRDSRRGAAACVQTLLPRRWLALARAGGCGPGTVNREIDLQPSRRRDRGKWRFGGGQHVPHQTTPRRRGRRARLMNFAAPAINRRWGVAILAVVIVVGILAVRPWQGRARAVAADATGAPVVAVARVDREDLFREINFPAEFRPYTEVDLHAKVSGYVKDMKVDIGDRVKAGQLLAVLEVPELREELDHAVAAHQRAQAEYRDAHLAYTRLVAVNQDHPNLIAQQDLDTAEAHDATAQGTVAATKADVDKDRTLVAYTRITAPFAGVITKRFADPGSL